MFKISVFIFLFNFLLSPEFVSNLSNKAELCTVGWREMQYIETRKKAQLMLYDCLLN